MFGKHGGNGFGEPKGAISELTQNFLLEGESGRRQNLQLDNYIGIDALLTGETLINLYSSNSRAPLPIIKPTFEEPTRG